MTAITSQATSTSSPSSLIDMAQRPGRHPGGLLAQTLEPPPLAPLEWWSASTLSSPPSLDPN